MTADELRAMMGRAELRQADVAWLVGVGPRHVRSWCNNEYAVPQYAALILAAYVEGLLPAEWLVRMIPKDPP